MLDRRGIPMARGRTDTWLVVWKLDNSQAMPYKFKTQADAADVLRRNLKMGYEFPRFMKVAKRDN
jgi:hypothetical protein